MLFAIVRRIARKAAGANFGFLAPKCISRGMRAFFGPRIIRRHEMRRYVTKKRITRIKRSLVSCLPLLVSGASIVLESLDHFNGHKNEGHESHFFASGRRSEKNERRMGYDDEPSVKKVTFLTAFLEELKFTIDWFCSLILFHF